MANTKLNMQLLLRRDNVFAGNYVLAAGEPGFEISSNTLKIGNGTSTWNELPIANKSDIEGLISSAITTHAAGYYTKAEVDKFVDDLEALIDKKLDTTTYNTYVEAHKDDYSNAAIDAAIKVVSDKFADYKTAAAQKAIDDEQDRRLGVLEGAKHTHDNKDLLDSYTQTEANLADAVAKKHEHSFNDTAVEDAIAKKHEHSFVEAELNKVADGDVAKWNTAAGKADTNAQAIENLDNRVGTFTHATAKTVVEYINAKTDGIATSGNLEALGNRVTATEQAIEAINNEETGVLAQAKAYVDSEDVFHTDITTVNALGGIAAGADLDGMTTHEILNTLLFPYVAFVLGSTSRSAAAATLENGATQTLSSASISITKKSKPITSVKLLNGSTVLGEKTGDDVAAGGTIKFENLGITVTKDNNPNLKFTVTDGTTSTDKTVGASTFVYPYYTGECAADATIDETLIEGLTKKVESKGAKTVTHTCENGRMVIAYPKAHGVLKSILDPNNFETIGDYTRSEVSVTGLDGTAQTYYVYASGAATVSGFKVQYKY